MTDEELTYYARIGAQAELTRIYKMFPDLIPADPPTPAPDPDPPPVAIRKDRRKGRSMSVQARKAVSRRMRAYWKQKRAVKTAA